MYNKSEEQIRKPMTFEELVPILNHFQKEKARTQIRRVDRAKTTLTHKQQVDRFAKMGGVVYTDKAIFTYDLTMGMSVLITANGRVYGATISDFYKVIGE